MLEIVNAAVLTLVFCKMTLNKSIPDFIGGLAIGATYFFITMACPTLTVAGTNPAITLPLAYFKANNSYGWASIVAAYVGAVVGVLLFGIIEADASHYKENLNDSALHTEGEVLNPELRELEQNRNSDDVARRYIEYEKDQYSPGYA